MCLSVFLQHLCFPACSQTRRSRWSATWPFMMSSLQSQAQKPLIYKRMCFSGGMVKTCLLYLIHKNKKAYLESIIFEEWIKTAIVVALGDPCAQPTQLNNSVLHPCTNATKHNYFDGSEAGFGIFIIVLFLFPVGQYHYSQQEHWHHSSAVSCKTDLFWFFDPRS